MTAEPTTAQHATTSPLDVEDLRVRVHKVIDTFLARQSDVLDGVSPECAPMVDAVAELMRGGKRLRPAFCYWGWRGAGGADCEQVVTAAAALEFFQAAALIHDDVMDDSDTRRGMPAVHRRFATLHRGSGWTGDGERFGLAGAVLAGDLCLVWSDELFQAAGLDATAMLRGRAVFDRMRTELMGGQYLDMLEQAIAGQQAVHAAEHPDDARPDAVSRARRVIRFKSAKYTIEQPLLIGGALAGASPELLAAYSAYGLPLGEAFQLRDDVLGVFGDPEQTGKPAGDDLREGKRTVLVAKALETASPAQAGLVRSLLGDPGLDAHGVEALREVIVSTGALEATETLVDELVGQCRAALASADVDPQAREVLEGLVVAATARAF
ncbi:polyprenyl synthetase family protein [Kineosporia sp. R_H_3]|uniref:polyprenyl synthetase family protein n=1 Tax=Kineosporia sp. R_H_3 TaxID=1961848 RepID=UPI000B4B57A2|nr:polyprenyl synthetase family protein [Kineosporia sp. R_H_3]